MESILKRLRSLGVRLWSAVRSDLRFYAVFAVVFILFRTTAFATYHIPSESMVPTLEVGDRVIVNKFAYGYSKHSVPFSFAPSLPFDNGRLFGSTPDRGDVAVFKHPQTGETLIKRVIGMPGDRIQVAHGVLLINGAPVNRETMRDLRRRDGRGMAMRARAFLETLPEGFAHPILEQTDNGHADMTDIYVVPDDALFMMGDNRDNSADSRFASLGFVPIENLVGRADFLPFTLNRCRQEPGFECPVRPVFAPIK